MQPSISLILTEDLKTHYLTSIETYFLTKKMIFFIERKFLAKNREDQYEQPNKKSLMLTENLKILL